MLFHLVLVLLKGFAISFKILSAHCVQLCRMNDIHLVNKPYVNEVNLREQTYLENTASLMSWKYVFKKVYSFQRGTVGACW